MFCVDKERGVFRGVHLGKLDSDVPAPTPPASLRVPSCGGSSPLEIRDGNPFVGLLKSNQGKPVSIIWQLVGGKALQQTLEGVSAKALPLGHTTQERDWEKDRQPSSQK